MADQRSGHRVAHVLTGLLVAGAVPQVPAQSTLFELTEDGSFGVALARAGDIDGDGHADLVVAAPAASPGVPLAGVVEVRSGFDGSRLVRVEGRKPSGYLGAALGACADLDGDGVPDILAAEEFYWQAGDSRAFVFSGADGSMLHELHGTAPDDHFGTALEAVGDVDADGFVDLLVGAPQGYLKIETGPGYAQVFSGFDGHLLYTISGGGPLQGNFGYAVGHVGDADADGFDDMLIGAPLATTSEPKAGAVFLVSGQSGATLGTSFGNSPGGLFGRAVCGAGDADADGVADYAVGGIRSLGTPFSLAAGSLISGVHGQTLWSFESLYDPGTTTADQVVGWDIAAAGDVDVDGHADLIISGHLDYVGPGLNGSARVLSGSSGSVLYAFGGSVGAGFFGWDVAGLGDVDGNGVPDVAAGTNTYIGAAGYVRVVSGNELEWQTLGGGSPGGSLVLEIVGTLQPNAAVQLRISGGAPLASALVVFGTDAAWFPTHGATLVPTPDAVVTVSLDVAGSFDATSAWPASLPAGIGLWAQAWSLQANAYVASDAVHAAAP